MTVSFEHKFDVTHGLDKLFETVTGIGVKSRSRNNEEPLGIGHGTTDEPAVAGQLSGID